MARNPDIVKDILAGLSIVEAYRGRASEPDVYALSGREGRADAAEFVARKILERCQIEPGQVVVDIGCGEGTLLRLAAPAVGNGTLVGILPTAEEADRARAHLTGLPILIRQGFAQATALPDRYADRIVMNGVLLLLPDPEAAVKEMARIARTGALVFVGEVPYADEFAGRHWKNSILRAHASALRHGGPRAFLKVLRFTFQAIGAGKWRELHQRKPFWISAEGFADMVRRHELEPVAAFPHLQLKRDGSVVPSPTRNNYLLRRL